MKLFEQAGQLARAGRPQDGVRLIESAAERGDADGCFILAHWLLYGSDRPRDARAAYDLLQRAADSGKAEALRVLGHLTGNGTGCEPSASKAVELIEKAASADPVAAAQLALLRRMPGDAGEPHRDVVSSDPHIEIVRQLLSAQECAYLIARAEPLLKPSYVDDGRTGIGRPDPIRTSHGAAFLPHEEDLVVQAINRRIAEITGTSTANAEALYVMRYEPGQQYRPHMDALPGLANQREWTAIAYLSDGFEGGATTFPELSLSIRLGIGDVLIFRNSGADQQPDARMIHAGAPVTSGQKWIATRWIRHGRHDPYDRG